MAKARRNEGKPRRKGRTKRPTTTTCVLAAAGTAILALAGVRVAQRSSLPGEAFGSQGNQHIADVGVAHPDYNSDPPTSGWHVGSIVNWGAYDYVVPDELLLHNLEDGGVVLWYAIGSPEQNRDHIDALQQVARGYRDVVIAPREGMPTPYAATAWQRLQRFDELQPDAMRAFLDAFEGVDRHN